MGSLEEEFALLGAPFADRGDRGDDALRALRASLGRRQPSYAGTHYRFDGFVVDPPATRTDVPLWIGGRSYRSLRRAVELADGWAPFGVTPEQIGAWLARARDTEAWAARARPLEIVLYPDPQVDPVGDPEGTDDLIGRYLEVGATVLNLRFRARLRPRRRRPTRGNGRPPGVHALVVSAWPPGVTLATSSGLRGDRRRG